MSTYLKLELRSVLRDIEGQISQVREDHPDVDAFKIRTPHGDYVLQPLIVAKAHVLAGLAQLEGKPKPKP